MARSSSKRYTPSEQADELFLFATNDERTYNMCMAVVENLRKKYRRGTYDADRAIDAFFHAATFASLQYSHLFGGPRFKVSERFTAAQDLRDYFTEDICQG